MHGSSNAHATKRRATLPAAALLGIVGLCIAWCAVAAPVTVTELLANTRPEDWRTPDPDNTLYLELPGGRVVIELAPLVAPKHVANIKALLRARYFDGLAIVRVQDNYVVQWNDPKHDRPVPAGVTAVSPEFTAASGASKRFKSLPDNDDYAPEVGFLDGFPAARDKRSGTVWLTHCYGMVGVGRDDPAESDGTEMYAVIGNSPRQLDRNVALVGRVLKGIELLSTLPRGSGDTGVYVAPQSLVPIISARLASGVPVVSRTPIQVLRTDSLAFQALLEQRRNHREAWFKFNPHHINICNVPLPARE